MPFMNHHESNILEEKDYRFSSQHFDINVFPTYKKDLWDIKTINDISSRPGSYKMNEHELNYSTHKCNYFHRIA